MMPCDMSTAHARAFAAESATSSGHSPKARAFPHGSPKRLPQHSSPEPSARIGLAAVRLSARRGGSLAGAQHWAIVASLVATAKLNVVEPLAWLTDVLERAVSGRAKARELKR